MLSRDDKRRKHTIYMREYRALNADKINARRRENYNGEAAERIRESVRSYRANNPEKIIASNERRREANRAYTSAYRKANPDVIKTQIHRRRARLACADGWWYTTKSHIEGRMMMWGGKCRYCGSSATSIDHRIPLSRGGSHFPANMVPACSSCNSSKRDMTESEFLGVTA